MDIEMIKYHREYFKKYYGNDFIPGQGIEEILSVIYQYGKKGTWLDLGAGTNSFFWRIPFTDISFMTLMDKDLEAYVILNEIKSCKYDKGCYQFALRRFNKKPEDIFATPVEFIEADLLKYSISRYTSKHYNNITQFGLWGLLKSSDEYLLKIKDAVSMLEIEGVLISANWIFEGRLIEERGYNNKYLRKDMIENFCKSEGLRLKYLEKISIKGDPDYSHILLYVINK